VATTAFTVTLERSSNSQVGPLHYERVFATVDPCVSRSTLSSITRSMIRPSGSFPVSSGQRIELSASMVTISASSSLSKLTPTTGRERFEPPSRRWRTSIRQRSSGSVGSRGPRSDDGQRCPTGQTGDGTPLNLIDRGYFRAYGATRGTCIAHRQWTGVAIMP